MKLHAVQPTEKLQRVYVRITTIENYYRDETEIDTSENSNGLQNDVQTDVRRDEINSPPSDEKNPLRGGRVGLAGSV